MLKYSTELFVTLQPLGVTKIPLRGTQPGLEDGSRQPESKPEKQLTKSLTKNLKNYNARETELKIGKNPGYYYVMTPELYLALNQKKVIREAALFRVS